LSTVGQHKYRISPYEINQNKLTIYYSNYKSDIQIGWNTQKNVFKTVFVVKTSDMDVCIFRKHLHFVLKYYHLVSTTVGQIFIYCTIASIS